ncbi:MAG: VTT domain-containing protein [Dehalococcoidales bacterium]|nr:VTT domain-containing protein [Dehalococcoidales bacterium]
MSEKEPGKNHTRIAYFLGIFGIVATILMAGAVIYYWEWVRALGAYGYVGAFLISILGGATIIVPVPMLAVVFALGRVMEYTWLVGIANGLGETIGALTIYMTGYGGGSALYYRTPGRLHTAYVRMTGLMERRGWLVLFVLASVLNPFFYPAALAAGALRFGVKRYFIITWAGKTIKGMTVAYAGYWGLRGLLKMLGAPI